MPARQRLIDLGTARGRALVNELAREAEQARIERGLTYATIGRTVGLSRTQIARICQGRSPDVAITRMAQILAVVGLELAARAYPGGPPIRDAAQVALLRRFRGVLGHSLGWRAEVPVIEVAGANDRRAWDGAIDGTGLVVRVEAETAIRDAQAVIRRVALKQRDGGVDRVVLVISDTQRNRRAVAAAAEDFRSLCPISARSLLRDLRAGIAPSGNGLLFL